MEMARYFGRLFAIFAAELTLAGRARVIGNFD
jgi:hypothetical protein